MFRLIKRIVCSLLFVAFGCVFTASADNRLALSETSGTPNTEVAVSVALGNTDAVSALQLTLPLGKHLRYVDGSCVLSAARSNGHTLTASQVDDELRIYIYSLSLSPLQGNTGELLSFRLRLGKESADYALLPDVVLSDATGANLSASVTAGQVTILAPKLQVLTQEIDYGHIPIRATYTQSLSLQNVGNLPLTISGITTSDPLFAPATTTLTIAPNSATDVPVVFAPVTRGKTSAQLSVTSNAVNGVQRATLFADPFSVNELHVGSASGIADSLVTIPLTMNNMEPIVAMQCTFRLPEELVFDAGSFRINAARTNGHTALSAVHGDTLSLYIYSPTNQPLLLNDGEVASFRLLLNGNSGNYYLTPVDVILGNVTSENMVSATTDGEVSIQSPRLYCDDHITFADAPVTDIAHATLSVHNDGDAPLVIERATSLAEGYRVVESLPISVSPWSETTLTMAYQPQAEGNFSTTMNLYTNDPTARLKPIALSGHIYEPNSLSVEGTSRQEDGTYTLSVSLSNYTDIVAAQFDVHWIGTMATSQAQCTPSPRLQQHNYSISRIGDADYRVLVYSMANTPISGHDGELLQLLFSPEESGSIDYCGTTLTIDNVVLSNANGENKQSQSPIYYRVEQPRYTTDIITTCDKYVWGNQVYTESGNYIDTLQTIYGCDSIVTLHLTVNHSAATEFSDAACDVYVWNGKEYAASGDYIDTLETTYGCDSIVTLHLTINHSAVTEFWDAACDAYVWNGKEYAASGDYIDTLQTTYGCDSIVTLHLTVNHSAATDTIVIAMDSLLWENDILRESGDYIYHFMTSHGCDSIITLHLTIKDTPTALDAHTGNPYFVYPNPATNVVYLNGGNIASISIFSSTGRLVYYSRFTESGQNEYAIDVRRFAAGMYMIVLQDTYCSTYTLRCIKIE